MKQPRKASPPPGDLGGFQPSLFGYLKPTYKLPAELKAKVIARIKKAKAHAASNDGRSCAEQLREARYALEIYERTINTSKHPHIKTSR